MDPEFAAAVATIQRPTFSGPPTMADLRAHFDSTLTEPYKAYLEPLLPPASSYTVRDVPIPVDGGHMSVRCLVPIVDDTSETFPVFANIHGGGWSMGNVELDDYHLRIICVKLKIAVVNVEYRLAPEHPFPTAVDDCMAALKWTVQNAPLLKADLQKGFIVGGESAGGNLTAVVTHIARDDPLFAQSPLTGQVLQEPFVIHESVYPDSLKSELRSMEENKSAPLLSKEDADVMMAFYNAPWSDPCFSPLLYPSHRGLPRAFIQAMQLDILRDDALVYEKALREAGVETRLVISQASRTASTIDSPRLLRR